MQLQGRTLFLYFVALLSLVALVYALSFSTMPPADFTFVNGTEIESVDPAIVTGSPEGRIINALFEGLYRGDPKTLEPRPAIAESCEISDDKKVYTFTIQENVRWSDGSPFDARDFYWSWMRLLHPETASQYAYQLYYYVERAEDYYKALVKVGDTVEVELDDRPDHPSGKKQLFPRGTIVHGTLKEIVKPTEPKLDEDATDEAKSDAQAQWKKQWVYVVQVDGKLRRFSSADRDDTEKTLWVLLDFRQVGIELVSTRELRVRLKNPTPYFLQLTAFYPTYPVNRACIEKHGVPNWTRPENLVTNGPYRLKFRRIRDRIRLVKNPLYWNAANVSFNVIDALAVTSDTTCLNMYLNGQVDWATVAPSAVIPILQKRDDFISEPMLTTYFYRINVNRKPLDQVLVRRALNMAIDKRQICESILRAGQVPARSLVPPGLEGYPPAAPAQQPLCGKYDVEEAKRLLAEAGFPGGKGLPTIEVLYNTSDAHRTIAEKIQSDWKKNLGIDVELKNQEWSAFLASLHGLEYTVGRSAWVGDYPDPNTFLDMFKTGGSNNETGWSNARYDQLIEQATTISNPQERLKVLAEAEQILMEELPIIPIYFYVSINLVRPGIEGFYPNIQDVHPLHVLTSEASRNQGSGKVGK